MVMIVAMIFTIYDDLSLTNWADLTQILAQINVTIALGYTALVAGVAALMRHKVQLALHKDNLYGLMSAFIYFIIMNLWLLTWSFSESLLWATIPAFCGVIWSFLYLSNKVLKTVREMLNAEER